ncbi:MAG TPA: EamA family transporter, partial [Gemmatimonadota bacterium]|nr:EamA family transporter [Gemmatimonadota bacterium]
RSLAGLAYLIVLGSLVAYSAYMWVLRHASASLVSTYAYVNPVVAVFLGWLVAGETLDGRTLAAAAVIVAAVAVIITFRRPARPGGPRSAAADPGARSADAP